MKRILFLITVLTIFGGAVKAQSADEKVIAANCKLLNQALITRDKALLERLVATKLSYGHSNGDVEDKTTFVKNVVDKKPIYVTINIPSQTINIADNNAIVRQTQELKVIKEDKETDLKIGNLLIWQKQGKAWKLLVKQGFKL